MRIFILPLTASLFLLSSTVFGEEVKDVGLICEVNGSEIPNHSAFWLKGDGKMQWYNRDTSDKDNDGDTVEYYYSKSFSEKTAYDTTDRYIFIHHYDYDGKLSTDWTEKINRFTLKLEEKFMGYESTSDCKVYASKDRFLSEVQKIEADLRVFLKKRKI